uniref:citrate lyase acyl carrier protein n=1 Tax=Clostridium sp. NkU-1 TaxID=1095009 RepID=UPI0032616A2F
MMVNRFVLESAVMNQYGNRIRKVIMETLRNLSIDNVRITVVDKGALDCTIKARVKERYPVPWTSLKIFSGEAKRNDESE